MEWIVTDIGIETDPVEVTEGLDWGVNEDGQVWSTPGDTHRRFVPGVRSVTMTLALAGPPSNAIPRVNDKVTVSDA